MSDLPEPAPAEPDDSDPFWASVDASAGTVVVVLTASDRLLGVFSSRVETTRAALRSAELCTLIPQVIDVPEWGNVRTH